MGCQYYDPCHNGATSFTIAMPRLTFGRGCLAEVGQRAAAHGFKNVALVTDPQLLSSKHIETVKQSLSAEAIQFAIFHDIRIEPSDECAENCAAFLDSGKFDAVVSLGGGSVIDTSKSAVVLHKQGGKLQRFFAPPVGEGAAVEGNLLPHIACPTTSGTGSECTSVSVIRVLELNTKFVISSPHLLPLDAIVDPSCTDTLPDMTVASTGFDLLCHALECYTATAYTKHHHIEKTSARHLIQGANPFSELIASKALQIADQYLARGVADKSDKEARDQLMWGASLAGIAFGNSGTHLPHALSYGITHLMKDISTEGYTVGAPFIPHGISVALTAPSVFRFTAEATPERHFEAAGFLGCETTKARPQDSGELLSARIIELMKQTNLPSGLAAVGFQNDQVTELAVSAARQKRAILNNPRETNLTDMENIYSSSISYW